MSSFQSVVLAVCTLVSTTALASGVRNSAGRSLSPSMNASASANPSLNPNLNHGKSMHRPDVVYGDDNRQDLFEVRDAGLLRLADSTVALFRGEKVEPQENGRTLLNVSRFGENNGLCADERFYDQSNGAYCSGTLVAPDLILTAGHCITSSLDCANTIFVFGFGIKNRMQRTIDSVPTSETYECQDVVEQTFEATGVDYALIRLSRSVTNHRPAVINRNDDIAVGTPLVLIGHPSGLPTKIAAGAAVRSTDVSSHFVATTDSYAGNSGSGVFNARTGKLEGVLVRGESDFAQREGEGCLESVKCEDWDCRGEDVTRISAAATYIP